MIRYGKYGKFSGPFHAGGKTSPMMQLPEEHNFLMLAFWVLAKVECEARFGVVNMRDGTGVTAGLFQAAACLPRFPNEQGPLFELLWRIDHVIPLDYFAAYRKMQDRGWCLGPGGALLDISGRRVSGAEFRAVVTPVDGVVPSHGANKVCAEEWCRDFVELFEFELTRRTQVVYGIEYLVNKVCRFRTKRHLNGLTLEEVAFGGDAMQVAPFFAEPHADLAHVVMLSFFINAPDWALTAYDTALRAAWPNPRMRWSDLEKINEVTHSRLFAAELLGALTKMSKKWDDDVVGSRYQRTRQAAMESARWQPDLFESLMKANIPD